jgi:hypothetical protein
MSFLISASVIVKSTSLVGSEFLRGAFLTVVFHGILKFALQAARMSKFGLLNSTQRVVEVVCHQVVRTGWAEKGKQEKEAEICLENDIL